MAKYEPPSSATLVPTFSAGFFLGATVLSILNGHPLWGIVFGIVAFFCAWQE